jgi:O-antigen/teichoic acid export membrane protein
VVNVALNYLLISAFGMIGAAVAAFTTQVVTAVLIAVFARAHDPLPWDYRKLALAPLLCLVFALGVNQLAFDGAGYLVATKVAGLAVLFLVLNFLMWGDIWFMTRRTAGAVRKQFRGLRPAGDDARPR